MVREPSWDSLIRPLAALNSHQGGAASPRLNGINAIPNPPGLVVPGDSAPGSQSCLCHGSQYDDAGLAGGGSPGSLPISDGIFGSTAGIGWGPLCGSRLPLRFRCLSPLLVSRADGGGAVFWIAGKAFYWLLQCFKSAERIEPLFPTRKSGLRFYLSAFWHCLDGFYSASHLVPSIAMAATRRAATHSANKTSVNPNQ